VNLRLPHPPTPEFAATHAQLAVDAARNIDHVHLDYSPASLGEVDRILGKFHAEGLTEDQMGATVFSFGCYVGEVLVRNNSGRWVMPGQSALSKLGLGDSNMMVVELPDGGVWNPIMKAFKLLKNGESDSVAYFYRVATKVQG
jgi:hypothetical protein